MASYVAKYRCITPGRCLLGGVKNAASSRFQTRKMANDYIYAVLSAHDGLGIDIATEVVASDRAPEIFVHCGDGPATCVGGHCFRCHKLLTQGDAESIVC